MNDISTRTNGVLRPVGRDVRRCHSLDAERVQGQSIRGKREIDKICERFD